MKDLDEIERSLLQEISCVTGIPDGAYNFRINGKSIGKHSTKNINVIPRRNGDGITVRVADNTIGEVLHIPVLISASGLKDVVYNTFYVGENCDITIIAGCGIYNCGADDSIHDGMHTFVVGKNSRISYIEKHCGVGPGAGKILNPHTSIFLRENSQAELLMEQIKGVDSTSRLTNAVLEKNSNIVIKERLFTHGKQTAESKIVAKMLGINSAIDIISRAVAQDSSTQIFKSRIVGKTVCRGHSECDAIIMDKARVSAEPALDARDKDAELVHEAAIGKIAGEQLTKLMTLGLSRKQAEAQIINGFLR